MTPSRGGSVTIGEPLITGDKFILENFKNPGIKTIDLKEIN